jgi:hypothetical protein
MNSRYHRPGIAGPILLIGLGVVFLLNNLGLLSWSVWDVVLRLWPLLLVAWGLDLMLGRRSAWGAAVTLIIILALFAGGVVMLGSPQPAAESLVDVDLPLEQTRKAQITLDPALAFLRLDGMERADSSLLRGSVLPFNGERVEQNVEQGGTQLQATVRTAGVIVMPFLRSTVDRASWDFSLHPEVEYDLRVDVGGGKTDLFLSDLWMSALDVHTGIGQTILYLPERGSYTAEIDGGLGHILIHIPDDVGVRLSVDVGIGSIDVPKNFHREGGLYVAPGYDEAENQIEVRVDLGIGSVEVR